MSSRTPSKQSGQPAPPPTDFGTLYGSSDAPRDSVLSVTKVSPEYWEEQPQTGRSIKPITFESHKPLQAKGIAF